MICGFLLLASFPLNNNFKDHPCGGMDQYFIPFYD